MTMRERRLAAPSASSLTAIILVKELLGLNPAGPYNAITISGPTPALPVGDIEPPSAVSKLSVTTPVQLVLKVIAS